MHFRPIKGGDDRRWTAIAVTACVALLGVLAFLAFVQYGQVSELRQAELRQLSLSLRATAESFANDFTSELLRVATAFRIERESVADPLAGQLEEGYRQWLGSAMYPQLVRDIMVVRPDNGRMRVWRFQFSEGSGSGQLIEISWPQRLAPIKGSLSRYSQIPELTSPESTRPRQAIFIEDAPALAIPFLPSRGDSPGWLLVDLNGDLIVQSLLPALFDSYFGPKEDSPYRFGIVSARPPQRVVYASDEFSVADVDAADIAVNLPAEDGTGGDQREPRLQSMQITASDSPQWRLVVKHKPGALDGAVDGMRWRNLAIGAFVLLALAVAGALAVVSAGRTRRLARMQMELAAAMSHELRTPLAVIRAAAYNLKEGVVADKDGVQRYAGLVQDAGRRLSNTVDQILLFAETQSDPTKIDKTRVDVGTVVDRAMEAASAASPRRPHYIERDIPDNLPEAVADPLALSHCIQNLIVNGLKYGNNGPDRPVRITAEAKGAEVEIHVSDCGPGISRKHLRHIFKPFYRAAGGASPEGGTGMGLALVERLMEGQGGRVSVRTGPQAGSSFVLHVPRAS
jgi:signal transduction histidine kinase